MKFSGPRHARPLAVMAICSILPTLSPADMLLLADTNRDGVIDPTTDAEHRNASTSPARGALFLNNNDSDQSSGEPDWADAVVNGEADLEDLAIIQLFAPEGLTPRHRVRVSVDEDSATRVRLFAGEPGNFASYASVDLSAGANLDPMRLGDLELRIEANTYAHPAWNGETTVTLSITTPGGKIESDSIRMRVAPFVMLSNAARAEQVYVRAYPGQNEKFVGQLREIVPLAGAELIVVGGEDETPYRRNHIWFQDTMEVGYHEMPGKRMSVVMPANRNKTLDNYPKDALLGPDYGWFQWGTHRPEFGAGDSGNAWLDWYGNLEVTPPLPDWPLGRIYYGKVDSGASLNPEVVAMLDAQGVQGPALALDVDWLLIKHVDEMVSFIPTGNADDPWRILVVSATEAIRQFENARERGAGNIPILGPYRDAFPEFGKYPELTVNALLTDEELMAYNRELQETRLDPMIESLLAGTDLSRDILIPIPYLQTPGKTAVIPNMVNCLVLDGHIIMSDPHGPVQDGQDLLQEAVRAALSALPQEIHFVADDRYHKWSGNVHCATNARRQGFLPNWWSQLPQP